MAVKQGTSDYNRKRREPGRIAAIIFAVLVHAAFLMLLVFGVSWQSSKPEPVQAELWSRLPPVKVAETKPEPEPPKPEPPKVEPKPPKPEPPKVEPKPKPPQPTRAEIELKDKVEKLHKEKLEREKRELEDKQKKLAEEKKKRVAEEQRKKEDDAKKVEQQKAEAARIAAEQKAREELVTTQQKLITGYINRIKDKIRGKANVPDSVTGRPRIEIRLNLLIGGEVLDAKIEKSSGKRAYDEAIMRAIQSASPLPFPTEPELFTQFRELKLIIEHEK